MNNIILINYFFNDDKRDPQLILVEILHKSEKNNF